MADDNITELYTQMKVLAMIEVNDSITIIQQKTALSFVTAQKAIGNLEKKRLIKTEKKINKKGKTRECIWFSKDHQILCINVVSILSRLNSYLDNEIIFSEPDIEKSINKLRKVKIKIKKNNSQHTLDIY